MAAKLPKSLQIELKRLTCRYQIATGKFLSGEPESELLPNFLSPGDIAIDVGANLGHYTLALSNVVGAHGRVIAIEPIPQTFSILASNVQSFPLHNVTLINAALSRETGIVGMSIPKFETGLDNFYMAQISSQQQSLQVMSLNLDSVTSFGKIKLIKIDAEGHELYVVEGLSKTIVRDKPILIVEDSSSEVRELLHSMGYSSRKIKNSPNLIFEPALNKANNIS